MADPQQEKLDALGDKIDAARHEAEHHGTLPDPDRPHDVEWGNAGLPVLLGGWDETHQK